MAQPTVSQHDLQERISAIEASLARSRRQLAEAQALSETGSWEWDITANVVWWSDELFRIYGMEPGELTPTYEHFLERVHPDDRASVDERNRRAFADHQPFEDVKRVLRADGRQILMRTQGEVICDAGGKPLRMVGICQDVTAQQRAAERGDARALAQELLDVRGRLMHAGSLIAGGDREQAAAAVADAASTIEQIADTVLGEPGAAARESGSPG
jgi:PAS domain S-box-containing protein